MSVKNRLMEDMKQAMKDKDAGKIRLSAIRMVRASIKNVEIDQHKELSDDEVLQIIAKEVKTRRDSLDEFKKAQRSDLIEQTEQEIAALMEYLPEQLTEFELRAIVIEVVNRLGGVSPKDMGRVMADLMPQVKGRADGKRINELVREQLNK